MVNEGATRSWKICFRRAFNDWELDYVDLLFDTLYTNIPREEGQDRWNKSLNGNCQLDVRSNYKDLRGFTRMSFPKKSVGS